MSKNTPTADVITTVIKSHKGLIQRLAGTADVVRTTCSECGYEDRSGHSLVCPVYRDLVEHGADIGASYARTALRDGTLGSTRERLLLDVRGYPREVSTEAVRMFDWLLTD